MTDLNRTHIIFRADGTIEKQTLDDAWFLASRADILRWKADKTTIEADGQDETTIQFQRHNPLGEVKAEAGTAHLMVDQDEIELPLDSKGRATLEISANPNEGAGTFQIVCTDFSMDPIEITAVE